MIGQTISHCRMLEKIGAGGAEGNAEAACTVGFQPLGSTKSSFTAPGCDVDSQCAWYKISARSPDMYNYMAGA